MAQRFGACGAGGGWRERFARAKRCSTARGQRRRPRRLPNNALLRPRACTSLWHRSFQAAPPSTERDVCVPRMCAVAGDETLTACSGRCGDPARRPGCGTCACSR